MAEHYYHVIAICDENDKPISYLETFYHSDTMPSTTKLISKTDLYYTRLDADAYCSLVKSHFPHINFKVKNVKVYVKTKIKLID